MIDIQIAPYMLSEPDKRTKVFHELENIFELWNLKKIYEGTFGQTHIVVLNNDNSSITATVKAYPFGLITVTFEYSVDEAYLTDTVLEEMKKLFINKLDARSEKIPHIKRGLAVPVYFTTADERVLEYDFDEIVFAKNSPYQNIKILHSLTFGNCLFLDNVQRSDINYTHTLMKYGVVPYKEKEVLILSVLNGGVLHEVLKENPKFVTVVERDQIVIDACREHLRDFCGDSLDKLEGSNYKVIIADCVKILDEYKNEGRQFDVVINDLTDFAKSPKGEIRNFIEKILIKCFAILKDDGSYLNHGISKGCADTLKNYENVLLNLPVKVKFEKHVAFIPSFMENLVFYEVKRKLCHT